MGNIGYTIVPWVGFRPGENTSLDWPVQNSSTSIHAVVVIVWVSTWSAGIPHVSTCPRLPVQIASSPLEPQGYARQRSFSGTSKPPIRKGFSQSISRGTSHRSPLIWLQYRRSCPRFGSCARRSLQCSIQWRLLSIRTSYIEVHWMKGAKGCRSKVEVG